MIKRIKSSNRGLTFSLSETDISIGSHYRYIVDLSKRQVCIIPDANGKLKVSKKKCGKTEKPLFDIRSKEVRELISNASYLEVEILKEQIVVTAYQKKKARFRLLKNRICSIEDVLGTASGEIVIPYAKVAGAESYQYTIDDWLTSLESYKEIKTEVVTQVSKDAKKVYDIVSLFSGAGLFDKAWLSTGRYRFVYANDFCEDVIDTYTYNIGNHITCKDVRDVKGVEIPFADVFSCSPCCQAFSNANRRNEKSNEAEEKRLLVEEVVRLVHEADVKPKVVVVENVPQMITKEKGIYLQKLLDGLPEYDASVQVVTDCNLGGFTMRKRCIVILSRIGKIFIPDMKVIPFKTVKDALSKVDATWYNYNDFSNPKSETLNKMIHVKPGGNWRDIPKSVFAYGPETHSSMMRRLAWDEVAPTITNVRKNNMMPPNANRCLSVSEAAALMGLEKDFRFLGDLSAKQQMVANGVTQAIGRAVSKAVTKALDSHYLSFA